MQWKTIVVRAASVLMIGLAVLVARPCAADVSDVRTLMAGVGEVMVQGGIPGDFAVFGDQAFVVLTGRMGKSSLPVMAAARYGQGRAVAAGHEGFFGGGNLKNPANIRLVANIAAWAGGRAGKVLRVGLDHQDAGLTEVLDKAGCRATVLQARDFPAALKNIDVLWLDQASLDGAKSRPMVNAVRGWVKSGGGLVITGPAWGWQSVHESLSLTRDHSGNQLLLPMGIAFAGGMLEPTGKQGYLAGDVPTLTHSQQALNALEARSTERGTLTEPQLEQATTTLGEAIGALPETQSGFVRRVERLCEDKGSLIPSREKPITQAMPFARLKAVLDMRKLRRLPASQVTANPAAASFPGLVPADAARETRTVTVDTAIPLWHGTGLYAAPGEIVTVTLPASAAHKGLSIRIGSHSDTLWHLERWERFPEITMSRPLDAVVVRVASPFGGALFVEVPEACALGKVQVNIAHAVAAPRFVRGVTDIQAWKQTIRNAPAPWAELEGNLVTLSVPSSAVRDLEDPEALMAYWDEVMEHCYAFYAAPKRGRPERYCVDRQISAGYMHSGYPIMTGDDVGKTFCDLNILRGKVGIKCWGFYHEMGHNFQQPEWTWDAFGEVTNNLFSLYGTETMNDTMIGAHPAMTAGEIEKREHKVATAPGKERYYEADPWYPLTMFWLMRHEFGWRPFTQLFAEFQDLPSAQRPTTEREKHDQFLIRFSKVTGHNLSNYLTAWGVDTSPEARKAVADLPAWMPADWPNS